MKRLSLLFAFVSLVMLSSALVHGQGYGGISLDHMDGLNPENSSQVLCSTPIGFHMRLTNLSNCNIHGSTNGFRVWMKQGSAFDSLVGGIHDFPWDDWFDLTGGLIINEFPFDPVTGAMIIGFGGAAFMGPGIPAGFDEEVWHLFTQVDPSADGDTICIDSTFYPPGGPWLWAMDLPCTTYVPTWDGPHCFHVYYIPDCNCIFDDCPGGTLEKSHCEVAQVVLTAHDQDPPGEEDPCTFTLLSGPGNIVQGPPNTVTWSYAPSIDDVCITYEIAIEVDDGMGGIPDVCVFYVHFYNDGLYIQCNLEIVEIGVGNTETSWATATDDCCDPLVFFLAGPPVYTGPIPGGGLALDATWGLEQIDDSAVITFFCGESDTGFYDFTVCVTDTKDTACCILTFHQTSFDKFDVEIANMKRVIQGTHVKVPVTVTNGTEEMGGFDFLIAYDASALTFMGAEPGQLLEDCGWEYFTYRYGPMGNCGDACPSGLLRIIAIAETNNGPFHPSCYGPPDTDQYELAKMRFLVTNDRTFECTYVPIRFFWMDCGDNTISSKTGDTLYVSDHVYDFEGTEVTDATYGFPTYFGIQEECFDSSQWYIDPETGDTVYKVPQPFIDFYNGGIDIACAESLDARGDVNLNGVSNEVADAVLFSNYFIYGLAVFHINFDGQVAATDVNADGMVLSVGDLVYQIRIIVGDAPPYPKLAPVIATYAVDNGVVSVDAEMGAAYVVAEGNITPTLLADNMEMKYNYDTDENVTRILVYSMEKGQTFAGAFLDVEGKVVSIEMATYEGAPVTSTLLPTEFALHQNFPNPFNPITTISFSLPVAADYDLVIYNVMGQEVASFSGRSEPGIVKVDWDASNYASGVYLYKLTAGNFADTKKMVLLK